MKSEKFWEIFGQPSSQEELNLKIKENSIISDFFEEKRKNGISDI